MGMIHLEERRNLLQDSDGADNISDGSPGMGLGEGPDGLQKDHQEERNDEEREMIVDINTLYDDIIKIGPAQYLSWALGFVILATEFGEIALLGILIPMLRCEWDLTVGFEGAVTLTIYLTYFLSVPVFGRVCDRFGRRPPLLVGSLVVGIGGVLSAAAPSKWVFLLCRVITGMGIGIVSAGNAIFLEITPNTHRVPCVVSGMMGVYVGKLAVSVAGYFLLRPLGWRWFTALAGIPCLIAMAIATFMPESPRYLIVWGKEEEAMASIRFIAKLNRVSLPPGLRVRVYDEDEGSFFRDVFAKDRIRHVIALGLILGSNLCVVYGLVVFLPLALMSHFCGVVGGGGISVPPHTCTELTSDAMANLSLATFSGLIGTIVGCASSMVWGRLYPIRTSTLIQTLVISGLFLCTNTTVNLSAAVFITGVVNCIEWIVISEVFPTKVRASSIGFINAIGKLGGIIGSSAVYGLLYTSPAALLALFLVASGLCFAGTIILNTETKHILLQDVDPK